MTAVPRVGFVLEEALGHAAHANTLRAVVSGDNRVDPWWCLIPFEVAGFGARVPLYNGNWTVRAGLRARRALRAQARLSRLDALFIHTQVPAVLATDWMRRVPTVVSLDATPLQYDAFGDHYSHTPGNARVERLKFRANQRCFERASRIVTWSSWAKRSLVADYGVPDGKVTVLPPGVWFDEWRRPATAAADDGVVRILFVGGDLERKGGTTLLAAFRRLRATHAGGAGRAAVELHLVTKAPVDPAPGVHVHRDMTPNAPELRALYHRCDIFCLPTRADMLALVLSEAAAAGLALVTTAVGGIPELVRDGDTGLVVPPDDVEALVAALDALVVDPDRRRELATRASAEVRERFDAGRNARLLVDLVLDVAADPARS